MRIINEILEWPAEEGHQTTSVLFPSLLAGEPGRYLENSVLTKSREAGDNANLPLDLRQTAFCLPTRALEVLAHRCRLVAKPQATAHSRDSTLAPLLSPAVPGVSGQRSQEGACLLSHCSSALPLCRTRWVESPQGAIFSPHIVSFPPARYKMYLFFLEAWADYFLLRVLCLHFVNRARSFGPGRHHFEKIAPGIKRQKHFKN